MLHLKSIIQTSDIFSSFPQINVTCLYQIDSVHCGHILVKEQQSSATSKENLNKNQKNFLCIYILSKQINHLYSMAMKGKNKTQIFTNNLTSNHMKMW